MIKYIFGTYAITIALFSCTVKNNNERSLKYRVEETKYQLSSHSLILKDTLYLELDSLSERNFYYENTILTDSMNLYVVFNAPDNSLRFYDLKNESLVKKVNFKIEGPDALPNQNRFYVHNLDSIFFINKRTSEVSVFDANGKKVGAKKMTFPREFQQYAIELDNFYQFSYIPTTEEVTFWLYPVGEMSYDGYDYWEGSRAATYNITTDNLRTYGGFSKHYFEDDQLFEFFEFINGYSSAGNHYLFFHGSPEVLVYNEDHELVGAFSIPCDSYTQPKAIMNLGDERPSDEKVNRYHTEVDMIAKMFSNKSGKYHVRIIKEGVQHEISKNEVRDFYDKPFLIQVLNSDLDVLIEKKFDGKTHDFYHSFIAGNDLYISYANPLNQGFQNEDVMPFAKYVIVEK